MRRVLEIGLNGAGGRKVMVDDSLEIKIGDWFIFFVKNEETNNQHIVQYIHTLFKCIGKCDGLMLMGEGCSRIIETNMCNKVIAIENGEHYNIDDIKKYIN